MSGNIKHRASPAHQASHQKCLLSITQNDIMFTLSLCQPLVIPLKNLCPQVPLQRYPPHSLSPLSFHHYLPSKIVLFWVESPNNFPRKAPLKWGEDLILNPPRSFGCFTDSHLNRWYLLSVSVSPHKNWAWIPLIFLRPPWHGKKGFEVHWKLCQIASMKNQKQTRSQLWQLCWNSLTQDLSQCWIRCEILVLS